jgi:hypothetical protein
VDNRLAEAAKMMAGVADNIDRFVYDGYVGATSTISIREGEKKLRDFQHKLEKAALDILRKEL